MTSFGTLFRAIMHGLQAVIAPIAARDRARTALFMRVWNHLNRTATRLETLFARWQTNTIPKSRPKTHPTPPRTPRPDSQPRLPRGQAWLARALDHHDARTRATQLETLLATPDCARFLAEIPRARRLLRPLARALGIQMPGDPPPPQPKPAKPHPSQTPHPAPASRLAPPTAHPNPPVFSKWR